MTRRSSEPSTQPGTPEARKAAHAAQLAELRLQNLALEEQIDELGKELELARREARVLEAKLSLAIQQRDLLLRTRAAVEKMPGSDQPLVETGHSPKPKAGG